MFSQKQDLKYCQFSTLIKRKEENVHWVGQTIKEKKYEE